MFYCTRLRWLNGRTATGHRSKPVIPATRNGLPAMATVSAMQKAVRRGMEREAMEFAVELMHTSKAFHSMVCKRLEIISHEDIDTQADPAIVPFVATAVAQAMKWYDAEKLGASRLAIGNAIRLMCLRLLGPAKCPVCAKTGCTDGRSDFDNVGQRH